MNNNELIRKNAALESRIDHLETELYQLEHMLVACGFSNGIQTLKDTIHEILASNPDAVPRKNSSDLI